jgi:hypothetical protein
MKCILTILIILAFSKAHAQWELASIDTFRCLYKVSSLHYDHAKEIVKQGYVVRMRFVYMGDRMPCADGGCDYIDRFKTIAYLDRKKKVLDETKWYVWKCELLKEENE